MIQKISKFLIATFLFLGFFTVNSFAQTSKEFHFNPGWQQGDEATYQNETKLSFDIKEYPIVSGLWMTASFDEQFQVLSVSKKAIRVEAKHANGNLSTPLFSKMPLSKDKEQQFQTYLKSLVDVLSSLRQDYDINSDGKIVRIHNKDEQVQSLEKIIDLATSYLPSSSEAEKQVEAFKKNLKKEIKAKPNPPLDPFGPHSSLIYNQIFTIGSIKTESTDFDLPKNPDNGAKGFKLSIPKEIRIEQTPRGVLVTEVHKLDNDWTGDAMRQIIHWTDPKKAEEIISGWKTLKMLGVTAYSDITLTNSYLFGTNSQWPEEMIQKVEWDFNTDIRVLKKAGGKETKMYPDTLTVKMNLISTYKLKKADSHDDTSPETEILPEDE